MDKEKTVSKKTKIEINVGLNDKSNVVVNV
jgi:hypothetical protein